MLFSFPEHQDLNKNCHIDVDVFICIRDVHQLPLTLTESVCPSVVQLVRSSGSHCGDGCTVEHQR